ncbi:hypothetical protein LCGC14_0664720 [marine sediment metagenome]|uniref:Uncharacterized protein n=1 Tax=marine sediment metagenome TaxID=412755 RepID=A0A0F9TE14_9ZZZZ
MSRKIKTYHWMFVLMITITASMYIYGMTSHYFPDPVHIGFGQYLDFATGIIILGITFSAAIIAIIFKKKKRGKR